MDARKRQAAEGRLALLETLLIAQERRHDVIDIGLSADAWNGGVENSRAT